MPQNVDPAIDLRHGARGVVSVRAAVYRRYGSPARIAIEDLPMPSPGRGQVLVKVVATSVNLSDWEGLRGSPAYSRFGGLLRPRRHVLGSDIAGVGPSPGRSYPEVLRRQGRRAVVDDLTHAGQ